MVYHRNLSTAETLAIVGFVFAGFLLYKQYQMMKYLPLDFSADDLGVQTFVAADTYIASRTVGRGRGRGSHTVYGCYVIYACHDYRCVEPVRSVDEMRNAVWQKRTLQKKVIVDHKRDDYYVVPPWYTPQGYFIQHWLYFLLMTAGGVSYYACCSIMLFTVWRYHRRLAFFVAKDEFAAAPLETNAAIEQAHIRMEQKLNRLRRGLMGMSIMVIVLFCIYQFLPLRY